MVLNIAGCSALTKKALIALLVISIVFLQEGVNYYASFQVLALGLVFGMGVYCGSSLKAVWLVLFILILFSLFLFSTSLTAPFVISRNSTPILYTVVSIVGHAGLILLVTCLVVRRKGLLISIFRATSCCLILVLCFLLAVSYLDLLSGLSRESLFLQNGRLITNFSSVELIQADLAYRAEYGLRSRADLFYGEPSYLALVLFTSLGCYMLCTRIDSLSARFFHAERVQDVGVAYASIILVGVMGLLSLGSFSGIIYAVLVSMYYLRLHIRSMKGAFLAFLLCTLLLVFVFVFGDAYTYLSHRLDMTSSLSLEQRFGLLMEMGMPEYLFGLSSYSQLPSEGIHNGILYLVAISGMGGVVFLSYLIGVVYRFGLPTGIPTFFVLVLLAQLAQNGAVFSPNKLVLNFMILLPLCSLRGVKFKRARALQGDIPCDDKISKMSF